MRINVTVAIAELKWIVFLALLLVSAAMILVPQCRIEATIALHRGLLCIASFWTTYRAWKLNQLSRTQQELIDGLANGSLPANLSAFERLSLAVGFLAALVFVVF